MELVECQPLLEWLANNYKSFGATLEIITDKSQEGSQFVRGFGGIGGKFFCTYNKLVNLYFFFFFLSNLCIYINCGKLPVLLIFHGFISYFLT